MTLRAEDAEPFTITPVPGEEWEVDNEPGTPHAGAGRASPNCQEDRLNPEQAEQFAGEVSAR